MYDTAEHSSPHGYQTMQISVVMENGTLIMTMKKKTFLQHKKKHKNTKGAYTDRSKSMGKKVGFVAVFLNVNRDPQNDNKRYI